MSSEARMRDAGTAEEGGPRALFTFAGGPEGEWSVTSMTAVAGAPLPAAPRLKVRAGDFSEEAGAFALRGVVSNLRYTEADESRALSGRSPLLGRSEAVRAALIPISKSAAWWALAQDERRDIFEADSRHIAIGLKYLPAIARRLHHGRDLGEPFDFLTWFEFAPEHETAFEDLLAALRATREWRYVEREVDLRLELARAG